MNYNLYLVSSIGYQTLPKACKLCRHLSSLLITNWQVDISGFVKTFNNSPILKYTEGLKYIYLHTFAILIIVIVLIICCCCRFFAFTVLHIISLSSLPTFNTFGSFTTISGFRLKMNTGFKYFSLQAPVKLLWRKTNYLLHFKI